MLQRIFLVLTAITLMGVSTVAAQENDDCSPSAIRSRIDELETGYSTKIANATDTQTSIQLILQYQLELNALVEKCASADSGTDTETTGSGTLADPYRFGINGDTGQGFSLRVDSFIRPADTIVHRANMFNDRPEAGQVYVTYDVDVQCFPTTDRCSTDYIDFELVGDQGVIYDTASVVLDDKLDMNLLGGASGHGQLVFLVNANDLNLLLLYRSNMFESDYVAYRAEPSSADGIQVTASSNLNIRNTPSASGTVVGSLPVNTPILAFGRNQDATWLQISNGWVFAQLLTTDGDLQSLPVTVP